MTKTTFCKQTLFTLFLGISLMVFMTSCSDGKPRLECSNPEAYAKSVEVMKENMTDEQKQELDATIMVISMSQIAKAANIGMLKKDASPEAIAMELLEDYCGLTAEEMTEKAKKIK